MSLLGKLISFLGPAPAKVPREFPARLDPVPGELTVHVHRHVIQTAAGPVGCLTYVTDGFLNLGHRELLFSLKCLENEDMPQDPVTFFEQKYLGSRKARRVEAGDQTIFGGSLLGFKSVVYVPAQRLEGVPGVRLDSLVALGLFAGEAEVVTKHGPMRVLSRLGVQHRWFPCPVWSDRGREPAVTAAEMEKSRLAAVPRLNLTRAVTMRVVPGEGPGTLLLRVMEAGQRALAEHLSKRPPGSSLALLTAPSQDADACLVWRPGQGAPDVFSPADGRGSRRLGSFLLLSPDRAEDGGAEVEDGFDFSLTPGSWERFMQAVTEVKPIDIPASRPDLPSLSLEWVDHASSGLDREFVRVGTPSRAAGAAEPVVLRGVVWLTPGAATLTPEQMGYVLDEVMAYQATLHEILVDAVTRSPPGPALDVYLECELQPDSTMDGTRPSMPRMLMKPPEQDPSAVLPKEALLVLFTRLTSLVAPRTKEKPLRFLMVFAVHGGSGLPMPVVGE